MKTKILCISALMICAIFLYACYQKNAQVMNAPIFTEEEIRRLCSDRSPFGEGISAELQVNGVNAAFEDSQECYYIPKKMDEDFWKGSLGATVEGLAASVAWFADDAFNDMRQAIREGHSFRCLIYDKSGYAEKSVVFTGLPVMRIDGEMGRTDTRIAVFDPVFSINGGYQTEESLAYYNIRGRASKRFEKIGYRLEFFYDDGSEGNDLSLLGMRSDNDWQLKALYSDRSKLRDKLSIELWNQIASLTQTKADDGCRMEYLELIVNGEYRGIYGLVEPTDYKSLELDKAKDIIYKASADEWPDDSLFAASEAEQSFTCAGISIRQAGKTFYEGIWEPFRTFWDSGYEMGSEEDLESLYACIDRQNFIDFALYCNVIAGVDNRFKNIIYSTVLNADGTFTIRRIPWDQNYSWGDDSEEGEDKDIKNIRFNLSLAEGWLNETVFQNMMEYDERLFEDVRETWETWRKSFLKEDVWKEYAREQMSFLTESGAFSRDSERWPDSENEAETEEIEEFIDMRFAWLDRYFQE